MNRWVNGVLMGVAALGLTGANSASASINLGQNFTYEELRGDVQHIMHTLDADFWKGVEEVGDELDPEQEGPGRRNISGLTITGTGLTMLSAGAINERARKLYPTLAPDKAAARYRRYLGRSIKKGLAKAAPRKSKFYRTWAHVVTDELLPEDTAVSLAKVLPRWANRSILIGGGTLLTVSGILYLLMVDFDYRENQKHPPKSASDEGSSVQTLKTVFGESRSEDEIMAITTQSPEIAGEVHHLATVLNQPL